MSVPTTSGLRAQQDRYLMLPHVAARPHSHDGPSVDLILAGRLLPGRKRATLSLLILCLPLNSTSVLP